MTLTLVGLEFGELTVVRPSGQGKRWICECSCGVVKEIENWRLLKGSSKSCGCLRRKPKKDLTGKKFARLKVVGYAENSSTICICQCDCGSALKRVPGKSLLSGHTKSCGCYHKERIKESARRHGMTDTPTYRTWAKMLDRCYNSNHKAHHYYGGRGITVCDEWRSFEGFYRDMGDRPNGKTLDRIDNDGPYAPWNCEWRTMKEQSRNRRSNVTITFNGSTKIIADWASEIGMEASGIRWRLKNGWTVEDALTTPSGQRKRKPSASS